MKTTILLTKQILNLTLISKLKSILGLIFNSKFNSKFKSKFKLNLTFNSLLVLILSVQCLTFSYSVCANEVGTDTAISPTRANDRHVALPAAYFTYNGEVSTTKHQEFLALYNKFKDNPALSRSKIALQRALAFFTRNKNSIPKNCGGDTEATISPNGEELDAVKKIENQDFVLLTDYTLPNPTDRFFILNIKTGQVESCPAAHGFGSNEPIADCPKENRLKCGERGTKCSIPINVGNGVGDNSGLTSRGPFIIDAGYKSEKKSFNEGQPATQGINALNLRGLLANVNDRALERSVVFHRASYAGQECSSSAGCPAICPELFEQYKDKVQNSLMYIHTVEDQNRRQPDC